MTDQEELDRLDTLLNERLGDESPEESAKDDQALIDDEMDAFMSMM